MIRKEFDETLAFELSRFCKIGSPANHAKQHQKRFCCTRTIHFENFRKLLKFSGDVVARASRPCVPRKTSYTGTRT
ncbi:MAG: hypothetical protein DME19_07510 [Verrucomicrobia bacterium]|nr:MAG: hypothetical protein DME19_07510 [Verrucomicrobiota bacterium]